MKSVGSKLRMDKKQDLGRCLSKVLCVQQLLTGWRTAGQCLEGDPVRIHLPQGLGLSPSQGTVIGVMCGRGFTGLGSALTQGTLGTVRVSEGPLVQGC